MQQKLNYAGESIVHYLYDEQGNEQSVDETASNNLGYFTIQENGELHWTSASEENLETCQFQKTFITE